jgi:hypothetical protein
VSDTTKSSADSAKPTPPTPPRTINLAIAAVCAQVLFTMIRVASMYGYTDQLSALLVKSNRDAKHPKNPYGPSQIAHDLHQVRTNSLLQGLVVGVALLLLAYSLRRSSAGITRWALLIVMVMTGGPFSIIPARGFPVVPQTMAVLAGAASIVTIVMLFMPDSRQYFRAVSTRRTGATVEAGAAPRPSLLGSLLRPQPRSQPTAKALTAKAPTAKAPTAKAPTAKTPMGREAAEPANLPAPSKVTKAKGRADAEAVARGAELARSRAKASKSRRTEA